MHELTELSLSGEEPVSTKAQVEGDAPLGEPKRVLHVGCGPFSAEKLHSVFRGPNWREIRVDIDPAVKPDIQASITDMRKDVTDASIDAIWSSHNIEHLYDH